MPKMNTPRIAIVATLAALCAGAAHAQSPYPSRPIKFIAPFPPGGSTDVLCRLLGLKLAEGLAQPVTVDNRPGASGNIGHEAAAKAAPDGYTILISSSSTLVNNVHLFKSLRYDPLADFTPISMVASARQVLVVHPSVPAKSVSELVALARAQPAKLNFGSGGKGIQSHISGEMFKSAMGVDIVHIPYKGTVQAVFPDVPTMIESGVPGYEAGVWWAVMAPRGTPADVVNRLNAEFARIMKLPDDGEKYASLGIVTEYSTPQQVTEMIKRDTPRMARVLKAAGVEPE